jgi:RNA polymerase sigma-70 factor (ECF subfamily)
MVDAMVKELTERDQDDLLIRAKQDTDALGALYEMYYERMLRFCVHRLFNRSAAEDATSTIFLNVARKIGNFKGENEDDFRRWLFTIASNHVNGHIRKILPRKTLLAEAAASRAAMDAQDATDSLDMDWPTVYQAIMKLNRKEQTIVTLRFLEGLSFAEIAGIVGAQESSVRVALHRSLKKLQNHLKAFFGGEL